jgi:hypothetical protein
MLMEKLEPGLSRRGLVLYGSSKQTFSKTFNVNNTKSTIFVEGKAVQASKTLMFLC